MDETAAPFGSFRLIVENVKVQIKNLLVANFRGITKLELRDLPTAVLIAGPNGCGKSCIFDAIRLLKSVYGGYQPNEWRNWFGEMQITVNEHPGELLPVFQNRLHSLELAADISLAPTELEFLRREAIDLMTFQAWKEVAPEAANWRYVAGTPLAAKLRAHEPKVVHQAHDYAPVFLKELEAPLHVARLKVAPDGKVSAERSMVLELVFSIYDPQHIGIINYHGPCRNYVREQVGGKPPGMLAVIERILNDPWSPGDSSGEPVIIRGRSAH